MGTTTISSFYWLVIASLAVWRVTHLVQAEDGPWNIIVRLRRLAGQSALGDLLDCFFCLSIWVAGPFAYCVGASWRERVLLWLALSGAAILLERISDRTTPTVMEYQEGDTNDVLLKETLSEREKPFSDNRTNSV
jgi:hypothetical protein